MDELLIKQNKILHSHMVAEFMSKEAKSYGINYKEAYFVGMMHDIGYMFTENNKSTYYHELFGAEFLKKLGLKNKYIHPIQMHGLKLFKAEELFVTGQLTKSEFLLTYLLIKADLSVDNKGRIIGMHDRLLDIKNRYGEESEEYINAKSNVGYILSHDSMLKKEK